MEEHFVDWPDEELRDIFDHLEEVFPEEDSEVFDIVEEWERDRLLV